MAPPWMGGPMPPAGSAQPAAAVAGNDNSKEALLAGAAKTLACTRLGATALPPRTTTPVVGEVLLFVPTLSVRSQAAPRPPPTRLQARVVWWGEAAAAAAAAAASPLEEQQGTLLFPRVLEGASSKAPLAVRAAGGRTPEPRSRETACLWPVRVEEAALWAYLGDMGRLVLRIEDADSGRPYATAALPLAEQRGQQRAATRLQRLHLHYYLEGEEDLGLSGSGRQRRRRRGAQAQGPVIGEAFVQLQVRMGPHSALRRLLSALGRPQPGAPGALPAGVVEELLWRVMDPDDALAAMALMGYAVAPGGGERAAVSGWKRQQGRQLQRRGPPSNQDEEEEHEQEEEGEWTWQGRGAAQPSPPPLPQQQLYSGDEEDEDDEEEEELVQLQRDRRRLFGAFEAEEEVEEQQLPADEDEDAGTPFPDLVEEGQEEEEQEAESGGEDGEEDLRASLRAFARDEALAHADEGSDRLPLWPPDAGTSPAPATAGGGSTAPSPAPSARRSAPPQPSALPPFLSSWDQFAATVPLPPGPGRGSGGDADSHLRRIKEALRDRRQRRQQQRERVPSSSASSASEAEAEEETEDERLLASLRGLLAGLRDAEGRPLRLVASASAASSPARPVPEYKRVAGPALWAMLEGLLGHEEAALAAGAESDEEDDLIRCLLAGEGLAGAAAAPGAAPTATATTAPPAAAPTAFPTLAAAERRRRAQLARARFLRVGFPTLTLLQGDKPPKRLLLRYAPPPPALMPPAARATVAAGGPRLRVEAAMVRGPGGDSAFSKLHPGSYVPERMPSPGNGGGSSNPLDLLVELDDAALAHWLGKDEGPAEPAAAAASLAVEVLVPLATLDRRSRDALLRTHPKPHPLDQPLLVARAALPLRHLLASPGLALGATLELRPTAAAAALWKTGKGRGGKPLLGTLAVECALVEEPAAADAGGRLPPRAPPSPRFAPPSSASSVAGLAEHDAEATAATTDKGASAFPPSPRRPDFSASSPLPRFEAAAAGAFAGQSASSLGVEAAAESAPAAPPSLRVLLHAGRVWGPALRALGPGETLRLRYRGEAVAASTTAAGGLGGPRWREARAGPADSTGQNVSACPNLRDFGHEAILPCGPALAGWLADVRAGRRPPQQPLPPMVLVLWAGPADDGKEQEEVGRGVEHEQAGGRLLGLVKLPVAPAALALLEAARPAARLLPFVGSEGPQPVVNPFDGQVVAHVEACLALGTDEQLVRLGAARAPLRRLQASVRGALSRRRGQQKQEGQQEQEEAAVVAAPDEEEDESEPPVAPAPRTRPLRLRELLERAEAAAGDMDLAATAGSSTASMRLRASQASLSDVGMAAAGGAAGAGGPTSAAADEEDDVSIGELLERRRRRAAVLASTAASSVSAASHRAGGVGGGVGGGHGRDDEGPFGLSGEDEASLERSGSRWTLSECSRSGGGGGGGGRLRPRTAVGGRDDAMVEPHARSGPLAVGPAGAVTAPGDVAGGGGEGEQVKHVLDVSVAGECRLEWASRAAVPPNLACYVRYLVRRSPLHALLGEASLSRHQDEAFLTAAGGLGPGADGSICSLLASAAGPVSDPAGWQAVCLWWDLEDCDLNSRARHVLYTAPPATARAGAGAAAGREEGEEGRAAAAALCGGEGLRLQVWVTGLEGGHGPARLIGTAHVPQRDLARLMRGGTGVRTLRIDVVGPQETSITSPPPPVRVRVLDLALSYYREPHLVARLRRSRGALALAAGRGSGHGGSGGAHTPTAAVGGHPGVAGAASSSVASGSGTLLTGLGLGLLGGDAGDASRAGSRLLYGESTIVDRVLPQTGRLCVELLDLTGPWPPRGAAVVAGAAPQHHAAPPRLFLEYEIETGHEEDAGGGEEEEGQSQPPPRGQQRRRVVRFSHRLPASLAPPDAELHFVDVVEVRLNDAFMESLFAGPLVLRLVAEDAAHPAAAASGEGEGETEGRSARRRLLGTLRVPWREVLTRLTGVSGVFPWCWAGQEEGAVGVGEGAEGGGARMAVYFQHQKPFLPARSEDDDDDHHHHHHGGSSGGGGGDWSGRGGGGGGVEESKRGSGMGGGSRGLFSITRFGSTTGGGGGRGRGRGVTEAILEGDEEEGSPLLAASFASLLEASTGSVARASSSAAAGDGAATASSSSAIAAAMEGLLDASSTGGGGGGFVGRGRMAHVVPHEVAPLDDRGVAAVQGLVSELSTLDRSLLSSFGGEEPQAPEQPQMKETPLASSSSREQGVQTEAEEEEEGETTATSTTITAAASSGGSGTGGGKPKAKPEPKPEPKPVRSVVRDVLTAKGNNAATTGISTGTKQGGAAAAAPKWNTRRWGDEETERIARIMLGKFSASASFSASE